MKLTDLRGILQYIPQFREKTFILAIDGAIVTDDNFATLLLDVALLWSLNIRVVLVHDASAQIGSLANGPHGKASELGGAGVTDAATTAYPAGTQGVDHLFTGKVERIDADLLQSLLVQGVPVIPPLGFDGEGRTYRVNSDGVALAVAEDLKATKLIFVTSQDGLVHHGKLIRQILVAELGRLVKHDAAGFSPEMFSKAQHATAACAAGVPRVHVIDGTQDQGLLGEVFSNHGLGSLIYANEYEHIRPAKKKDVRGIQLLTKQAVDADELLKRSKGQIERNLGDYFIFEIDKNPVACVALHVYPELNKGELACLCVSSSHENEGIGRKLIQFVEDRAFQSKANFVEGTPDDLPPARLERYEQSGRHSKVLVKKLIERRVDFVDKAQ